MKQVRLVISCLLTAGLFHTSAQDVITLKSGEEIKAKVEEISSSEIKYKRFDHLDGPIVVLEKAKVFFIKYENGTKEIINILDEKPAQTKLSGGTANVKTVTETFTYGQNNGNAETVYLSENMQSRNDVIVIKNGFCGIPSRITHLSDKHIYYVISKKRGDKDKKIKQTKVLFTLSFHEKVKQEKYPERMNLQDFLSLPTYNSGGWTVFGTKTTNLLHLKDIHPNIYNDFTKGAKLSSIAGGMYSISYLLGGIPLIVAGSILDATGVNKRNDAFMYYYNNCLDLEVCAKYGITITLYNTSLTFKKNGEKNSHQE